MSPWFPLNHHCWSEREMFSSPCFTSWCFWRAVCAICSCRNKTLEGFSNLTVARITPCVMGGTVWIKTEKLIWSLILAVPYPGSHTGKKMYASPKKGKNKQTNKKRPKSRAIDSQIAMQEKSKLIQIWGTTTIENALMSCDGWLSTVLHIPVAA